MKKRQRILRLTRAAVQILSFILAPSLFSTAFAGVKSVFLYLEKGQLASWNSFLNVTAGLLLFTVLCGRHFCGWMCAFGTLGDAVYGGFSWIWKRLFPKKKQPSYSPETVHMLQKGKYMLLAFLVLTWLSGLSPRLQGSSPWDVFSMLTAGRLPDASFRMGILLLGLILVGMCTQERFFCQFLCPMGAVFAMLPVLPWVLPARQRQSCPPKCGACKKRCPAHLDIDGDTPLSGECLCCHACVTICPRGNLHLGLHKGKSQFRKKPEK